MTPAGSQDRARPRKTSAGAVRLWVSVRQGRVRGRHWRSFGTQDSGDSRTVAREKPQERVKEIPQEVMEFVPDRPLELDFKLFTKCLQNAPSGCAPGPGGCTNEMLRTCLDDPEVLQLLFPGNRRLRV